MTTSEKIAITRTLVHDDTVTDELIETYLTLAAQRLNTRRFPFGTGEEEIPPKYESIQCELASRMIFRRGFEGETVSIENGIHRHFDSVNDEDLLAEVMQVVGVM